MLYLVGETKDLDARRAHAMAKQGTIMSIARGIYCDPSDHEDLPGFMKKNAIRIANYLSPDACLAYASAFYKGAIEVPSTSEGYRSSRLYVVGAYYYVFKLPYLEIVQGDSLRNPNYSQFARAFQDGREMEMGDLSIRCISDEVVFLQNFGRRRYHKDRFLTDRAMAELRRTLEERHGTGVCDRLSFVARQCGDVGSELDRAMASLALPIEETIEAPAAVAAMHFGWYRRKIAQATFDGISWKFGYDKNWLLPVVGRNAKVGVIPGYVANILPEGFAAEAINDIHIDSGAKRWITEAGERYLSNIAVTGEPQRFADLPMDRLFGTLKRYRRDGVFTGKVIDVPKANGVPLNDLRELVARLSMPRVPGFRAKLPMSLDDRGSLSPADGKPFTHILKFPGIEADPKCAQCAVEWACMDMAKAAGLASAESAMVRLPDGTIGLLSERFDIPRDDEDMRMLAAEDMCSALGMHPNSKYSSSYEKIAEKLREISTNFADDGREFFKQVCVSVLIENGDLHLKNVSVLTVASPMLDGYRSVRLAPAYDVLSTRPFNPMLLEPGAGEKMALRLNDKTEGISLDDLVAFGGKLDLSPGEAEDIAREVATALGKRAREIAAAPPELLASQPSVFDVVQVCCSRTVLQIEAMFPDLDCEALAGVEDRRSSLRVRPGA